jgi:hypothetical protein
MWFPLYENKKSFIFISNKTKQLLSSVSEYVQTWQEQNNITNKKTSKAMSPVPGAMGMRVPGLYVGKGKGTSN